MYTFVHREIQREERRKTKEVLRRRLNRSAAYDGARHATAGASDLRPKSLSAGGGYRPPSISAAPSQGDGADLHQPLLA